MDAYTTGQIIKKLRLKNKLTQLELAQQIGVSDKTVSKWETSKGLPDISLIQPLSKALGVSVIELMSGSAIINKNVSANMLRAKFYVCHVCGNILYSTGDALISCCGFALSPLKASQVDQNHEVIIEPVEDESFVTIRHEMTKEHYISFVAYVCCDKVQLVKFYPEGNAETRFMFRGGGYLYIYCNQHGWMKFKV